MPKPTSSSAPKSTTSTKPTQNHVYVMQSLDRDPCRRTSEQDLLGIYTDLKEANTAAYDYYNKTSARAPLTIPNHPTPEHESLRNGKYYAMPNDEGVDKDSSDGIANVRVRHDGGLRFGTCDEGGLISVVWVERRQLNPSSIPASTRPKKT